MCAAPRRTPGQNAGPSAPHRRTGWRPLWLPLLLVLLVLSRPSDAGAVTPEEKAAAREAATAGIHAFQEGNYDASLDLLHKAEQIMHAPPHLIYIARAHAAKGEYVLAREALMTLVNEVLPPDAPAAFHDAQAAGQILKSEVEPKIARLLIRVEGADGPVVLRVDGKVLPEAVMGLPYPVDPGIRTVVAESGNASKCEEFVTALEGQTQEVTLELTPPPPVEKPAPAPPPPPAPEAKEPPPMKSTTHPLVYAGFGTAAAGILVGAITGAMSIAQTNTARAEYCNGNSCSPAAGSALGEANTLANVSNVAFALAVVGAGAGVVGLLMPVKAAPRTSSTSAALPRGGLTVWSEGAVAQLAWRF